MHIKELTFAEFDSFTKTCPLNSYMQSSNYALFMTESNYEYDILGYIDELGIIKAAALILIGKINVSTKYGYSPKGFLIDYFDYDLLSNFTKSIKAYYAKKLAFIKINPEIAIGEININNKITNYNSNIIIRDYLKELGYNKLKDNLNFESLEPRFTAIVNLENYTFDNLSKNTKNKIRKAEKKGLVFEKGTREDIDTVFEFIKNKDNKNLIFYKNYYNVFNKNNACDIFLIKIDYEQYLLTSKKLYDEELTKNNTLNYELQTTLNKNIIDQKMNSDKNLLAYKNDIEIATLGLKNNKQTYIAGAIIIKFENRLNIIASGYNPSYKHFNANYFLHNQLIEYYQNNYKYLDLNGISGDFNNNTYKGLNNFKIGFKPNLYEFIGEFDLIINEKAYKNLIKKGTLAKEFNKKRK